MVAAGRLNTVALSRQRRDEIAYAHPQGEEADLLTQVVQDRRREERSQPPARGLVTLEIRQPLLPRVETGSRSSAVLAPLSDWILRSMKRLASQLSRKTLASRPAVSSSRAAASASPWRACL